tara:strand:- start:1803 stop:1982 length:180 start_codon:yes stop_codon:yes gene_type:complete
MRSSKIATYNMAYFLETIVNFHKKEDSKRIFLPWFLVWYLGLSILLLLSLHSYYMGFGK